MHHIQRSPASRPSHLCRLLVVWVILASALVSTGCRHTDPGPPESQLVTPSAPPNSPPPPLENGPGLIVCEPAATGGDGSLTNFGAGCGRWLEFELAGQPATGKSPDWGSVQRALAELGRSDLRLIPEDTMKVQPILGITHAAVGTITGNSSHCTLTYTLLEFPGGRPVGAPVALKGSEQEIIAGLPSVARKLAGLLHVPGAALPAATGMDADSLRLVGSVIWLTPRDVVSQRPDAIPPLSGVDTTRLNRLSAEAPLATMILLQHLSGGLAGTRTLAKRMMRQSPDNCLAVEAIGWADPDYLVSVRDQFSALLRQRPDNYLLNRTAVWLERRAGDIIAQVRAGEQEVRCSPANPDGWLSLAYALKERGDSLRQGRPANMLSREEWASLNAIYSDWLQATERATELDPGFGKAWLRVAEAACFAGNDQLADTAFWNAARLYKEPGEVYGWGLQMYQPKWLDQPDKLARVAKLIASNPSWTIEERVDMATELQDTGFDDLARKMGASAIPEAEKRVRSAPNNGVFHQWLAQTYKLAGRTQDAEQEYQTGVKLCPQSASAHYLFGTFLDSKGDTTGAIAEYRAAVRLDPQSRMAAAALAQDLSQTGQLQANDPLLQQFKPH